MNKYATILLLLLIIGLGWLYMHKEAGYKQRERALIEKHKDAMDSSALEAERWRRIAKEYGDEYRKAAGKAIKAENNLSYLKEQNEILKKRPVIRYNDQRLDSIMSARYGR